MLSAAFAAIDAAGLPAAELYVASDNAYALDLDTGVGMREAELMYNYARTPAQVVAIYAVRNPRRTW